MTKNARTIDASDRESSDAWGPVEAMPLVEVEFICKTKSNSTVHNKNWPILNGRMAGLFIADYLGLTRQFRCVGTRARTFSVDS